MIQIGNRKLGTDQPVMIVLEAGPTHQGLTSAKQLVDAAKASGADAIKFQVLDADRLMANRATQFSYEILVREGEQSHTKPITEPLYDILKRRSLTRAEWRELKTYCDEKQMLFFATAMYEDEVDFLVDELGVQSIKLASADINHYPLIRHMARKQINIQIDTGNADLSEIETAVRLIEEELNQNIIIHLCPTGYPARVESIHLRMIPTLKRMFPQYAVGFSDHNPGWDMDIAAVAMGAELVEKTITLDRYTASCEHMFSIEPQDCQRFVRTIRDTEAALGKSRRTIPSELKQKRRNARRSMYLVQPLQKGETLTMAHFEFKRPESGLRPDQLELVVGRSVNRNLLVGHALTWEDFV